ncbi:hypothetical protein [Sphingomonas sp. Leaf62]|uniref:hypothetical protein n=1 Tax=Sphingomonas sp. Leaf62 TaxID=1736228 RepID=UPI000A8B1308|nr:hypothetical protein [Sphingomonas sp. Leaf62]
MNDLIRILWQTFKRVDAALVSFFFDPPPKLDRCPECGGTDRFDGRGTCQHCDAI